MSYFRSSASHLVIKKWIPHQHSTHLSFSREVGFVIFQTIYFIVESYIDIASLCFFHLLSVISNVFTNSALHFLLVALLLFALAGIRSFAMSQSLHFFHQIKSHSSGQFNIKFAVSSFVITSFRLAKLRSAKLKLAELKLAKLKLAELKLT